MNSAGSTTDAVQSSRSFEWTVRLGLVSYGVVHLLIAWLALQLAVGDRSGSPSQQGAINQLAQQPFGSVLLWAVAIGFAALTCWQAIEAIRGEPGRTDGKEWLERGKAAAKAAIYAALALSSAQAGLGEQSSSNTDHFTAEVMKLPLGQLLVGIIALVIIGVGVAHIVEGAMRTFEDRLDLPADRSASTAIIRIGQVGYLAKGLALGVVGVLFGWAAITFDPDKSGGLDVALRSLLDAAYGPYILAVVAVGIGCFGIYCFAWARSARTTG